MNLKMSIGAKILVLLGAIVMVGSAIQSFVFYRMQGDNLTSAMERKAQSLVRVVAPAVAPALDFADAESIEEVLSGVEEDADVEYAAVFDAAGKLLASAGDSGAVKTLAFRGVKAAEVTRAGDFLVSTSPVQSATGAAGELVIGFSRASIEAGNSSAGVSAFVITLVVLGAALFVGWGVSRRISSRVAALASEAEAVAEGNLGRSSLHDPSEDEVGSLARSFDRMVKTQRDLVGQITDTAVQLNTAAGEFMATAKQQERGATEQSSAVEETRRTLEALLSSGSEIASTAQGVLKNAERTHQNSSVMAERISELSHQVQRITEILEVIKSIANKSELLALNAALEGTKAGEAGRGFSLVATQMQKLAENVMEAVRDIRDLTGEIREATQASVLATEESTKLSGDTTRSARQIALIIQQQQSGTEQVAAAMDDVTKIASQSAASAKQIVSSTTDMLSLCEKLQTLVNRFSLAEVTANAGAAASPTHDG